MAVVLGCAPILSADLVPPAAAEPADWLKLVPGDARFYVEFRDLSAIQRLFERLDIWKTVRDLTEKSAPGATTRPWQRATQEYLHITPETAIDVFFGRRAALIATESAQWQNGVMLAELEKPTDLRLWLRRWRARTLADEGPVHRYELPGGILLAAAGRTLAFGPAGDPEGLWGRTVLLLAGRRGFMLAGRSEVAALRGRLSANYPAMLYVEWPEGDPTAFQGCARLLVGASVTESGIACELRGQRAGREEADPPVNTAVLRNLPASSLAIGAGSFDFDQLTGGSSGKSGGGEESLLTLFLRGSFEDARSPDDSVPDIGPQYVVVVGRDPSPPTAGFDTPAITAICQARGGAGYVERLDRTIQFLARLLGRLTASRDTATPPLTVAVAECEGVLLHHIPVGPILAERSGMSFLDQVDVCWALLDDRLVLSTSLAHVQEIVRAARGKAPTLAGGPEAQDLLPPASEAQQVVEWWFARGGLIAEMVLNWLVFLEIEQPEALQKEWWHRWANQQLTRRQQLGVGLATDPANPRRAVVKEVAGRSPATPYLRVGDVIVAVAGSPLTTTRPAQEVADRFLARGQAKYFPLQILRDGKTVSVTIPVPPTKVVDLRDFDPIGALNQLTALASRARTATVWRYALGPDRFDARIQIRWEKPAPEPSTAPAKP
jgi:hypothetical protein